MKIKAHDSGFTIVELLIATTILTVVLASASFVLVQVGRLYYKGNITANTQQATRNIIDSISRPLQLQGAGTPVDGSGPGGSTVKCIGLQRFTYQMASQVGDGPGRAPHAIIRDTLESPGQCTVNVPNLLDPNSVPSDGESMLSEGMRLFKLDVVQVDGIYNVSVHAGYGELAGFSVDASSDVDGCLNQAASSQFCAYVGYDTSVNARIR